MTNFVRKGNIKWLHFRLGDFHSLTSFQTCHWTRVASSLLFLPLFPPPPNSQAVIVITIVLSHKIQRERQKNPIHTSTSQQVFPPARCFPDILPPLTHLSTSSSSSQHQLQWRVDPAQADKRTRGSNTQLFTDIWFYSNIEIYSNWSINKNDPQ